jgi:hypothetical protein
MQRRAGPGHPNHAFNTLPCCQILSCNCPAHTKVYQESQPLLSTATVWLSYLWLSCKWPQPVLSTATKRPCAHHSAKCAMQAASDEFEISAPGAAAADMNKLSPPPAAAVQHQHTTVGFKHPRHTCAPEGQSCSPAARVPHAY